MGTLRVIRKFTVFSTRSRRRFITFIIVFAILSGATILLISSFDDLNHQGLLQHRGVVVKTVNMDTVPLNVAQTDVENLIPNNNIVEKIIYYRSVVFSSDIRIVSFNTRYPWAIPELSPNSLVAGSFPTSSTGILISTNSNLTTPGIGTNTLFSDLSLGSTIVFRGDELSPEFKVTGVYKRPDTITQRENSREWIFMPEDSFTDLVTNLNMESQVYVHTVVVIAKGDLLLSDQAYRNVDQLGTALGGLGGDWQTADYHLSEQKEEGRNLRLLSLSFGLFGTFVVSTLYSYLITRFRRREVAILKAIGYTNFHVRIAILTEILAVAVGGFTTGLTGIQLYIIIVRKGAYINWLMFSPLALLSFIAVVASCVPGFILITTRTLKVRPIELFRQKG